jgi:hypothetical protein
VALLRADSGTLKSKITILGSTFGSITGVGATAGENAESDNIVWGTFSLASSFKVGSGKTAATWGPGVRVCRRILSWTCAGNECPQICPGEQANYFVARSDS